MKRFFLLALRAYQTVSRGLGLQTCRYYPSCSHYTAQAIHEYGILKGSFMGIWRILRCSPLHKGGYDPVKVK